MKTRLALLTAVLSLAGSVRAQVQKAETPTPVPVAELNAAETKFKELLSNVTLIGRWHPVKDGMIGEEKEDQYTITSIAKIKEDSWVVHTKMKYGEREMILPFPVKVKWAGDTPVIVVDQLAVPGGGTYSARVLFFEKTYAGSWTGLRGGGLLSGTIVKN